MLVTVISAVKKKLNEYLVIKEAASILGVSEGTLRNWDRQDKLTTRRHPINGYRLYKRSELEKLLASVHELAAPSRLSTGARQKSSRAITR
jgi:DNA (cytosine-5)-methyltransferase 1